MHVKMIVSNLATCNCENGKHLASIIDNSILCDEVIDADAKLISKDVDDETKTIPTNLMKRKQPVKRKISIYHLHLN